MTITTKYLVENYPMHNGLYRISEMHVARETESSIWGVGSKNPVRKSSYRGVWCDSKEHALECVKAKRLRAIAMAEERVRFLEESVERHKVDVGDMKALLATNPDPSYEECHVK